MNIAEEIIITGSVLTAIEDVANVTTKRQQFK